MRLKSTGKVIEASSSKKKKIWDGITEQDFIDTTDVEDREIGEFDKENMILFAANTNLFRQIIQCYLQCFCFIIAGNLYNQLHLSLVLSFSSSKIHYTRPP